MGQFHAGGLLNSMNRSVFRQWLWKLTSCRSFNGPMAQIIACDPFVSIGRSNSSLAFSGLWYVTMLQPFTIAAFNNRTESVFSCGRMSHFAMRDKSWIVYLNSTFQGESNYFQIIVVSYKWFLISQSFMPVSNQRLRIEIEID